MAKTSLLSNNCVQEESVYPLQKEHWMAENLASKTASVLVLFNTQQELKVCCINHHMCL